MTDDGLPKFETLEDHTVYWVERAAAGVRAAESFYRHVEDSASREPFAVARELWLFTDGRRSRTRRALIDGFEHDPADPHAVNRRFRDSSGEWIFDQWVALTDSYAEDDRTITAMHWAGQVAVSEGRDPCMAMVLAWIRDQRDELARRALIELAPWNDELRREATAVLLAGFAYQNLSFQYPRLRAAVGGRDGRLLAALLPSAVVEAWVSGAAQGDAALLPRAAERILEGRAERQRERRRDHRQPAAHPQVVRKVLDDLQAEGLDRHVLDWLQHCWVAPPLSGGGAATDARREDATGDAELAAREEVARRSAVDDAELAAEAARLMAAYGLSERQAQVAYLVGGQGWTRRAAASRLGIDDDTARAALVPRSQKDDRGRVNARALSYAVGVWRHPHTAFGRDPCL